ncbi:unnamed protein product [Pleuronectes platessa]|uniref:Uncharacterized protein n=1 Tax=Pleuronectes platessa TaxID=8262 RepID=A0A9N7VSJ4_PLEPL|nr:unnamed protein product [Pleuronectes platessa]
MGEIGIKPQTFLFFIPLLTNCQVKWFFEVAPLNPSPATPSSLPWRRAARTTDQNLTRTLDVNLDVSRVEEELGCQTDTLIHFSPNGSSSPPDRTCCHGARAEKCTLGSSSGVRDCRTASSPQLLTSGNGLFKTHACHMAQNELAFICKEIRAPVVDLPDSGRCESSCTVLGCDHRSH